MRNFPYILRLHYTTWIVYLKETHMSTHALIVISNHDADSLRLNTSCNYTTLYVHFDGYPQGLGTDIAEHLTGYRLTAGISGDTGKTANGMECLAAQVVANLKDMVGNVYLTLDHESFDHAGVDYLYFISPNEDYKRVDIRVEHKAGDTLLYDGPLDDFHRTITGPLGVAALWEKV